MPISKPHMIGQHVGVLRRLEMPNDGSLKVVIDTDAYNEVDDQFAIVYALRSAERLRVDSLYAAPFFWPEAPFFNDRSTSPADGMERSYDEIQRVLSMIDRQLVPVFRGSRHFLESEDRPVESAAAFDLVERVLASDEQIYVLALGALTNIASALILDPRIKERIVVVWLGGHALHWQHTKEFNLAQDVIAAQILFNSGVPVVHIPCQGVASHLMTSSYELDAEISGRTEIGTYLADIVRGYFPDNHARSKVIWDISTVAYVLDAEWIPTNIVSSPVLSDDCCWSVDHNRHPILSAYWANRDQVFSDMFHKINHHDKE